MPLTNRERAFLPGNVSSQVPPVENSPLLTVTGSDPVPLTESVIVPVYTVWDGPATGRGSVGVETLLHAVTAANTPTIKRIRIIATPFYFRLLQCRCESMHVSAARLCRPVGHPDSLEDRLVIKPESREGWKPTFRIDLSAYPGRRFGFITATTPHHIWSERLDDGIGKRAISRRPTVPRMA